MYVFPRLMRGRFLTWNLQYDEDVGRATGAGEVHEDFISTLSRISQLTGNWVSNNSFYMSLMIINRVLGSYIRRGACESPRIRYHVGSVILLHLLIAFHLSI